MNEYGKYFRPLTYKIIIVLQVLLFIAVVGAGSLHIYDYTEHDPTFCVNCHIMKQAFSAWETSIHKGVDCHSCHYASVFDRNKMLIKTFVERPSSVSERPHDKIIVPSTMCIKCHWEGKKTIPKISNSTGHAMHWFKGAIECTSCHAVKLHQFSAEQSLCVSCHAKGKVVLEKMKDMKCTECHDFRKNGLVPKADVCIPCHEVRTPPSSGEARTLAHQQFDCMTCHHTHDPGRKPETACQNCHYLTMKRGKHPIHLEALGNDCLACHKPHQWRIEEAEAKKICSECHKPYALKRFAG